MKTLKNLRTVTQTNKTCSELVKPIRARHPLTKIVLETQDLVKNRIVLSVLIDRDVVKISPAELLSNPYIVNRLSKAEVQRVAYLANVQESDATVCAYGKQLAQAMTKRRPLTKIMVETHNLLTDQLLFTVLHNHDLVKLTPFALMSRPDIISQLNKRDAKRVLYLFGLEIDTLKTKAEALMAECIA